MTATTEPASHPAACDLASEPASSKVGGGMVARRALLALWAVAFIPLFTLLRSFLQVSPLHRTLIGSGLLWVSALATLWFCGREPRRMLRAWRIFFAVWGLFLVPLLVPIAHGLAEEGWPSGRFNRPVARLLLLILVSTIPAFLTGVSALIRTYRVTAGLALLTGLTSVALTVPLLRATAPIKMWRFRFVDLLDIIAFFSKLVSYLSLPVGVALIAGSVLTFRATRTRGAPAPRG